MQCVRSGADDLHLADLCRAPVAGDHGSQYGAPLWSASPADTSTLLRALSAAGGERKWLTVLFADVKNSTALIDADDPEVAMQRLQPALDCMRRAVERYDGVVNRSQGDGVMALFGATKAQEDHAVRACLAALHMQDDI